MKDVLLNNNKLKLEKINLNDWGFILVNEDKSVQATSLEGQEKLINYYFIKNKVIKKEISIDQQNFIVSKLFEWRVVSGIDDETGRLVIYLPSKRKCN